MLEIEKKLVEDAKRDAANFVVIYDRYFDPIYRYVLRRVSDRECAHDLVSQTFYDALAHIKDFEWRGVSFAAWLYKVAHNNVLKWYRLQGRVQTVEPEEVEDIEDEGVDVVEDAVRSEAKVHIDEVLEQLNTEEREILKLKYFEEASNIEIAEIMGLSANHIGVKVFRALKKVKQLLYKQ